jgi:hypothetical protein
MNAQRIGVTVFAIIGVGLMSFAGWLHMRRAAFLDHSALGEGRVQFVAETRSQEGDRQWRVTIGWKDPAGVERTFDRSSVNLGEYESNQLVVFRYDTSDPTDVRALEGGEVPVVLLGAMGAVFLFIAVRVIVTSRRAKSA